MRKAKEVRKKHSHGKWKESRKGSVKCGCGNFSSLDGKDLVEHYRNSHPRISKQGFQGDINSIKDEKLRKFILRKRKNY